MTSLRSSKGRVEWGPSCSLSTSCPSGLRTGSSPPLPSASVSGGDHRDAAGGAPLLPPTKAETTFIFKWTARCGEKCRGYGSYIDWQRPIAFCPYMRFSPVHALYLLGNWGFLAYVQRVSCIGRQTTGLCGLSQIYGIWQRPVACLHMRRISIKDGDMGEEQCRKIVDVNSMD